MEPGRDLRGQLIQLEVINFRLNGKAVRVKVLTAPNITEGDRLVVCGTDKSGELSAKAVRYLTTGVVHHDPYKLYLIGSGIILLAWIPMVFILIGIPLGILAGYGFLRTLRIRNAVQRVMNAEVPQAAAA